MARPLDWQREGLIWPHREASAFVSIGGARWHVQRMGSGEPLLLLHGTGASVHSWRDLMPLLAQNHDVIAVDLPRHAFTTGHAPDALSLPRMAGELARLLKTLDITPAGIVGHSAGAALALQLALDHGYAGPIIGLNSALRPFPGIGAQLFPAVAKLFLVNPLVPRIFSGSLMREGEVEFGKGNIRGVAGPESANNAGSQTSFIPMLTLGIPPNAVMALMVGAMTIKGIQPGPQVMTSNPELFWGLIASMWVGNAMLIILNLPLIGVWVKLLTVPYRFLFPAIMTFCCIGLYTLNNNAWDVYMGAAFAVAILAIYILVVAQFKSFRLPLVILTPIPLTLIGIVIGHILFNAPFTATSMIGFIALAGIIVRNSILLVDFIRHAKTADRPLREVLLEAGAIRFKPIMLTALAAMIGAGVILFDPIFQGLAISLLFGLASSTLLTVLVIPAIYVVMRDDERSLDASSLAEAR